MSEFTHEWKRERNCKGEPDATSAEWEINLNSELHFGLSWSAFTLWATNCNSLMDMTHHDLNVTVTFYSIDHSRRQFETSVHHFYWIRNLFVSFSRIQFWTTKTKHQIKLLLKACSSTNLTALVVFFLLEM